MTKKSKGKYRVARAAEKLFSWTNFVDAKIVGQNSNSDFFYRLNEGLD